MTKRWCNTAACVYLILPYMNLLMNNCEHYFTFLTNLCLLLSLYLSTFWYFPILVSMFAIQTCDHGTSLLFYELPDCSLCFLLIPAIISDILIHLVSFLPMLFHDVCLLPYVSLTSISARNGQNLDLEQFIGFG